MRYRIGLLILFLIACAAALGAGFLSRAFEDFRDFRPGIGEPEQAEIKVKKGMTRDEVSSLLGRPHSPREGGDYEDEWLYRCDFFGGTLFRVYFGPDGRVTSTEWWLN